ncbi:hypothetical protein EON63_20970 [archaeon]|nr:MAG: hypothetical protein EON63_20970 [archaeon]
MLSNLVESALSRVEVPDLPSNWMDILNSILAPDDSLGFDSSIADGITLCSCNNKRRDHVKGCSQCKRAYPLYN